MKKITNRLVCFIYSHIFVLILITNHPPLPTRSKSEKSTLSTKRGILKSYRIPLFLFILVRQQREGSKKQFLTILQINYFYYGI